MRSSRITSKTTIFLFFYFVIHINIENDINLRKENRNWKHFDIKCVAINLGFPALIFQILILESLEEKKNK